MIQFFGLTIEWSFVLINSLAYMLIGGLMGIAFGGLQSNLLETKAIPNQGLQLSLKNALFTSIGFGLIFTIINGTIAAYLNTLTFGIAAGISTGFFIGLLAAGWYGGLDLIQHFTLTFILWYKGHIPRQYIQFLDYAASRIFLQKVGGGYIFIHRLLLEHFAGLGSTEISDSNDANA